MRAATSAAFESEALRRSEPDPEIHVLGRTFDPDGPDAGEVAVARSGSAFVVAHERVVLEPQFARMVSAVAPEDGEVDVGRDGPRGIRARPDGLEHESAPGIGDRPAPQSPRVRRRPGYVVESFPIGVVGEHGGAGDRRASVLLEYPP